MAAHAKLLAASLTLLLFFMTGGCQQAEPQPIVNNLPGPNFVGPVYGEKPIAPAAPQSVAVAPVKPLPPRIVAPSQSVPAEWIPTAPQNQWYWIVVHHSATPTGSAAAFNKMHQDKGWDELGYHFVIGNGSETRDGQIEVGPRWAKQKWGAHDKTPGNQYNLHGIGICLVGNFDVSHPSPAQLKSLERLVTYLMKTYHVPADHVLGHGETKATDCPGRYMPIASIRRACAQMVAADNTFQANAIREPQPGEELLATSR
jgi:N-acetylmuramoyl-L-alanine amidase